MPPKSSKPKIHPYDPYDPYDPDEGLASFEQRIAEAEAHNNRELERARRRDPSPVRYETRNFADLSKAEQEAYQLAPWLAQGRVDSERNRPTPKDSPNKRRKTEPKKASKNKKVENSDSEYEDIKEVTTASGRTIKRKHVVEDTEDDKEEADKVTAKAAGNKKR